MIGPLLKLKTHSILDSHLFKIFLLRELPTSKKEKQGLTLNELYVKPVQSLRKFLWELVVLQQITVQELPDYFTTATMILDELTKCCSYLKDIEFLDDERFHPRNLFSFAIKIVCVIKSNECLQFAVDALNVRDELHLEGDFSQIHHLMNLVSLFLHS